MQLYGEIGILADDGEKVQCHICGKWFSALNQHVMKKHGMDCDYYRKIYGLNKSQRLVGKLFQEAHRRSNADRLMSYFTKDELVNKMKAISANNRGKKLETRPQRRKSLATQITPEKLALLKELGQKGELPFHSAESKAKSAISHQTQQYKERARERVIAGINPLLRPDVKEKRREACKKPECRTKISNALKGRVFSEETKKKMSETHKRNPSPIDEKGRFKKYVTT